MGRAAARAPVGRREQRIFPQIQNSRRFRNPSVASLNLWEHWIIRVPAHPPVLFCAYQRPLPTAMRCGTGRMPVLPNCIGSAKACPGGTFDNSPAFQRRERATKSSRPEGTVEITVGTGWRFTGGERSRPGCCPARPRAGHERAGRTECYLPVARWSGARGRGPAAPEAGAIPKPTASFVPADPERCSRR